MGLWGWWLGGRVCLMGWGMGGWRGWLGSWLMGLWRGMGKGGRGFRSCLGLMSVILVLCLRFLWGRELDWIVGRMSSRFWRRGFCRILSLFKESLEEIKGIGKRKHDCRLNAIIGRRMCMQFTRNLPPNAFCVVSMHNTRQCNL